MNRSEKEILAYYFRFLDMWNPPAEDRQIIEKAIDFARRLHQGVKRKSGEPYILHPLEVAKIVAKDLEMDTPSIVAALLHDVVEDTEITHEDIQREFGGEVSKLVAGLTKIDKAQYSGSRLKLKAKNIHKLLQSFVDDPRVIIIKLADRLHNMRTLDAMRKEKQQSIASETEWLFIPLAHRLGIGDLKRKLGNETVKYSNPERYQKYLSQLRENRNIRNDYIREIRQEIYRILDENHIKGRVRVRENSAFDVLQLMETKHIDDAKYCSQKFRLEIIFEAPYEKEKEIAFKIYSELSINYLYQSINDFISIPKENDYRALETSFIKPYRGEDKKYQGHWVNIAIMSERMFEIANKGYALKYNRNDKNDYIKAGRSNVENWLNAIGKLVNYDHYNSFFLKIFEGYISTKNIIVFTRSGERKNLPENSTALDFAYSIHTELANRIEYVLINNERRSIFHRLKDKDIVNIISGEKETVSPEWLKHVQTGRAMDNISRAMSKKYTAEKTKGEERLKEILQKLGIKYNDSNVHFLMQLFNIEKKKELLYHVSQGQISMQDIERGFKLHQKKKEGMWKMIMKNIPLVQTSEDAPSLSLLSSIIHQGKEIPMDKVLIASCCYPIPGDRIVGIPIHNNLTRIHRQSCPKSSTDIVGAGGVAMDVNWKDQESPTKSYLAGIEIYGADHKGLLEEIVQVVSRDFDINMKQMGMNASGKMLDAKFLLYVNGKKMLNRLMKELKKNKYIADIKRISNIRECFYGIE